MILIILMCYGGVGSAFLFLWMKWCKNLDDWYRDDYDFSNVCCSIFWPLTAAIYTVFIYLKTHDNKS